MKKFVIALVNAFDNKALNIYFVEEINEVTAIKVALIQWYLDTYPDQPFDEKVKDEELVYSLPDDKEDLIRTLIDMDMMFDNGIKEIPKDFI